MRPPIDEAKVLIIDVGVVYLGLGVVLANYSCLLCAMLLFMWIHVLPEY